MVWKAWESSLESKKDENISNSSWRNFMEYSGTAAGKNGYRTERKRYPPCKITGEKLKDVHFDLAIASPLKRAYETAGLVLGDRNIPILTDERIEEISFGEWEGLCCRRENYQIPSKDFKQFFTDPFGYKPPKDGESIQQMIDRCGAFYEDLIHNPDYRNKTILIAAHGCSTRAFLYYIDGRKETSGEVTYRQTAR